MNEFHTRCEINEAGIPSPLGLVACKKHALCAENMGAVVLHKTKQTTKRLRIGFVPLSDCAPILVAKELNFFAKYGLAVELSREIGWASLRDKLCYGQLEAAHGLAPLVLALTLGLGVPATDCLTALVLSLEGNGITLAKHLWPGEGMEPTALRERLEARPVPLLLGVPFLYSAHHYLLREWLRGLGLIPERVAQFVVVPPPQMPSHLRAGNLDGYCVGEPWNSLAAQTRAGWLAATSAALHPGHPEKVLLVRREFAEGRASEHIALVAALLDACEFCQAPENTAVIAEILGRPKYVQTSSAARGSANGPVFFGAAVNEPSAEKADWVAETFGGTGLSGPLLDSLAQTGRRTFRADIFHQALGQRYHQENDLQHHANTVLE